MITNNTTRKETFPSYFDQNPNFKTLNIENEIFVDYMHQSDKVKDVQLNIQSPFLLYVVYGQVKLIGPSGEWHVNEKEGALVGRGGYIMSESLSTDNSQFKALLFFISDEMIREFCFNQEITSENVSPIEGKYVYHIPYSITLEVYVNSISLIMSKENGCNAQSELVKLKGLELLHHLHNDESQDLIGALIAYQDDEESIIRHTVEKNFSNNLSLEELAFLCNMSISNFKRKFEKYFNTTPGKWMREKKLKLAHDLLMKSNKTVDEVSFEAGFSSSSYFIKSFKDEYGTSPARLKQ